MSKPGGGTAPPSVDPAALATGQAQANIATANQQANLNNVRTTSPLAQSFFEQGADGRWNLNQSLSPQTQPVFNNQTGLAQMLAGTAGSVAGLAASPAGAGANIVNTAYDRLGSQIPTGPISTSDLWGYQTGGNVAPIQNQVNTSDLQPYQTSSWLGPIQNQVNTSDLMPYSGGGNVGSIQNQVSTSDLQPFQTGGNVGSVQNQVNTSDLQPYQTGGSVGPLQNSLSFSGLAQLPTSATDFSNEVRQAQGAAYNTQAGYLDPQFSQKRSDLTQRLADQGISAGTDAFSRAQGDLGRQETMAYQQAQDAAVAAGNEEQSRLFGENLASRQQGVGEQKTQGDFANAAQQLGYGETVQNAQVSNAARAQAMQDRLAQAGLTNTAEQIGFGQTAQNAQISNAARQQALQERLAQGGFTNTAETLGYDQTAQNAQIQNAARQAAANERLAQGGFANTAQQLGYGETAQNAQLSNAARQQALQERLAQGGFTNTAQQLGYNETAQNAQIGNQARQSAVNERALQWGQPLQALGQASQIGEGILSGASSQLPSLGALGDFAWAGGLPTFGGSPTAVTPANVIGAQTAANSANLNRFAAGNTLNNQTLNGLGSLGGAIGLGNGGLGSAIGGLGSAGGLFGSQGPLFGTAADASIAAGGAPLALDAATAAPAAWIVCTELMRQGKMPKRHYLAGAPVFAAYPEKGKNGYYLWAIPTVRHLRRRPESLFSKVVGAVFRWRAEDIAARRGVPRARKLWRGAAVTAVLYPICKMLGYVAPVQDWPALYREENAA